MRKRASALSSWTSGALLLVLGLAGSGTAAAVTQESAAAPGQRSAWLGLPLADALRELQLRGVRIVFTSQLVRPEMRVVAEPGSGEPRLILDEILAPHGLRAEDGVGGTVVVVPAPRRHALTGIVRHRESLEPLPGAVIRLIEQEAEARSDAGGHFSLEVREPGLYTLQAELQGFLPAQASGVRVAAGRPAVVELALEPMPYVHAAIVVRPSELSLLDAEPAAPLSLSRGDIAALPHLAGDLFRAVSLLPGAAGSDVTAQFHVHGGRRDEVLILLDGQELYEAFHLYDFDRALSVVEPGGLSGARLSTGAFPARYGDRMSGVFDLTTGVPASPRQTRLSLSLISAVAASGGTFSAGRGDWLASARRGSIDLASRLLGDEDPSFWDLFGKAGYRLSDRQSLRAHLLHAGDALDFATADGGESKRFDTDYDSSYLWLTHQGSWSERLLVETTASATMISRDRVGVEDEEGLAFDVFDRRDSDVLGLGQSWSLEAAAGHAVQAGVELRRYEAAYDYASDVEPDFVLFSDLAPPRAGLTRFARRFNGDHLAAHLSDRFSAPAPLTAEVGVRYDRHTLTGDTLVSPRASVAWRLGQADVLRASWGHFHQSQRPYELQVEDGETRFSPAERSEHWVIGYERILGGSGRPRALRAVRIEAYRRRIRNPRPRHENLFEMVNIFPEAEPDRVRIAPDSSHAEGVEVVLRGTAGARSGWWINYAYATATDRLSGRDVRRQTDQPHALNLYLDTRLPRSWSLSLAWRFHTGWPTTPVFLRAADEAEPEPDPVPTLGPLNSERLPSYHRLDLRLSREWRRRSGRLLFFLDLQNLYDRKNLAGFDFEVDEETGALLAQEESWPGFFPSVGITWEF